MSENPFEHQVWVELERHFRTRLREHEKSEITRSIAELVTSNPGLAPDQMTEITIEVVQQVLARR